MLSRSAVNAMVRRILGSQESGLVIVMAALTIVLSLLAGSHVDRDTLAAMEQLDRARRDAGPQLLAEQRVDRNSCSGSPGAGSSLCGAR